MQFSRSTAGLPSIGIASLALASCLARSGIPEAPAPSSGAGWRYEAAASADAREVAVHAYFAGGGMTELGLSPGAERFVRDVEIVDAHGGWRSVTLDGASWRVPECATTTCRVRYRFLLRDAARHFADTDHVRVFDGVVVARPATWLMHPGLARHGATFRLHVATPPSVAFATGMFPAPDGATATYQGEAARLGTAPFTIFGAFETRTTNRAGAEITIASQPGSIALSSDAVAQWVERSARTVGGYYGCFPVPRLLVVVVPADGEDVVRGHALGEGGAVIVVEVGRKATEAALQDDWVLPHEMVHMGFPSLDAHHHWLEEGIATYVQPIARARAGLAPAAEVWTDFAHGLPMGLPRHADRGLDHTPTWGRTYWGGAMYCLLADLEIRKRTNNRYSFDDALRGIIASGGNITVAWSIERALDAGDRAVGVPVLRELYAKMADRPVRVELANLWSNLGVSQTNGTVAFDDAAPLAALRRAITAPRTEPLGDVSACAAPSAGGGLVVQNGVRRSTR